MGDILWPSSGVAKRQKEGFYKICQKLFRKSFVPLLIQIHTLPHWPVLIQIIPNNTTQCAAKMFFEGLWSRFHGGPSSQTTWPYFDTHPNLAIFFTHISTFLLFWQSCPFCRLTFVKFHFQYLSFFCFEIPEVCDKTNPCTCVTSPGSRCSFE